MFTPEQIKAAEAKAAEEAAAKKVADETAAKEAVAKPAKPRGGKKAQAEDMVSVTVIGPATGRRRAGMSFGKEPVAVDVTEDQLSALESDPLLSVQISE